MISLQDISLEKIIEAISNYITSGPNNVPIKFYKDLIPLVNDDNYLISYRLNFIYLLYNLILNSGFPKIWNETSIISISKRVISLW